MLSTQVAKDLVFDVGMHRGEDTDFYLAKGFRVVAVEAMPEMCKEVSARRHEEIAEGRLHIVNKAIAEERGHVRFFANPKSVWGTIRPDWADRNARLGSASSQELLVEALTFQELLAEFGVPYYLKIDIEGADILCLEGLRGVKVRPRYVSIESEKRSWFALRREFKLLQELGYTSFKIVSQRDVPSQRPPTPAREGRHVDHRFTFGSSGLFGEEAPGAWLTRRRALRAYRIIFLRYWLYGDSGLLQRRGLRKCIPALERLLGEVDWYDTHARAAER